MAYSIECNLSTRSGFIEAIKSAGRYIEEHAENILGEYPSLLTGLTVTANFRFDEVPTVEITRGHIVCDAASYPQNSADSDTLESVATDLFAWIDGVLNKNWCMELPGDLERYKTRLEALGVVL